MKKVLIAMSGGVDSAVSALLLKEQGYEVTGANMRFWEQPSEDELTITCQLPTNAPEKNLAKSNKRHTSCCSPKDIADAEYVALSLNIPFYVLKMERSFQNKVIQPFIDNYRSALTPNPCVDCNTFIKFGEFYQKAKNLGFNAIATGHYAQVKKLPNNRYSIFPSKDQHKDQSYYLYGLNQDSLSKTHFPLAEYLKDEVRSIAEKHKLPVAKKPDSQEICFIPENNYRNFLKRKGVEFQAGFIKDKLGRILKKHNGKENFTIGQRKGLGLALSYPVYVLNILKNGDVIIGEKKDIEQKEFYVIKLISQGISQSKLIQKYEGQISISCLAQVRYNSEPKPANIILTPLKEKKEQNTSSSDTILNEKYELKVVLDEPTYAITPGQTAVFYDLEEKYILLGGKIDRVIF